MSNGSRDEIGRILKMVEDGVLDRSQAAELIDALSGDSGQRTREDTGDPGPARDHRSSTRKTRHRRRGARRRGRHHGAAGDLGEAIDDLGTELQQAIEIGSRTLKRALKQSVRLESWVDETNRATFSRADAPEGEDFICCDNNFTVSQLHNLTLRRATFRANELNAAAITDLEVVDGSFDQQHLRGSSLRQVLVENGSIVDNQLNGAQLTRLTLADGRVAGNVFNGAQIRDIGIAQSRLEESRVNAAKLKHLVLRGGSHVRGLTINGVAGRDWLFDAALFDALELSGLRVSGLAVRNSGLERCSIRTEDWARRFEDRSMALVRDLTLDHVIMKDCHFVDCRFDRTQFRDANLAHLWFEGVDFSGMALSSQADFKRLATDRVA